MGFSGEYAMPREGRFHCNKIKVTCHTQIYNIHRPQNGYTESMDKQLLTIMIVYNPELPEPWRVLISGGKIILRCKTIETVFRWIQEAAAESEHK